MPVCMFTFHAYRSWTEDNKRGYVQRGKSGVQPPNAKLARYRAAIAQSPAVRFNYQQKIVAIQSALELCKQNAWRLHAGATTPTHIHLVVSWNDRETSADQISALLKRRLGNRLSRHKGTTGNRWFSRGDDQQPVADRRHLDHLRTTYLPDHIDQHGCFWREGMAEPMFERCGQ